MGAKKTAEHEEFTTAWIRKKYRNMLKVEAYKLGKNIQQVLDELLANLLDKKK